MYVGNTYNSSYFLPERLYDGELNINERFLVIKKIKAGYFSTYFFKHISLSSSLNEIGRICSQLRI